MKIQNPGIYRNPEIAFGTLHQAPTHCTPFSKIIFYMAISNDRQSDRPNLGEDSHREA
jgi:hypothetical protein